MNSIYDPDYNRGFGFKSELEQEAVFIAHVAIAGVGGDGFQLGLKLARGGVQKFNIADPEDFERENANRVPGATYDTYGKNKAEVFADEVHKINPDAEVNVFTEGITAENIGAFLTGATLALDETELTHLELGTMLSDESRKRGIPDMLVMNVGFAAQVSSFHPDSRHSFRTLMGLPKDMPLDEVAEQKLDLSRCVPYLPMYADIKTLAALQDETDNPSLPSIGEGVDIASGIGSTQAFLHMVNGVSPRRPQPIWAPRMAYMDAYNFASGVTRFPRLSYYAHLGPMVLRNLLNLNPEAGYSKEDRARRAAVAEQMQVDSGQ